MYVGPITRAPRSRSVVAKRAAGMLALLACVMVMVPYLLLCAVYAGTLLGIAALRAAPKALVEMVDYAGGVVLGR